MKRKKRNEGVPTLSTDWKGERGMGKGFGLQISRMKSFKQRLQRRRVCGLETKEGGEGFMFLVNSVRERNE